MSVYISFDESTGDQIASNRGWSDVLNWAEDTTKLKVAQLMEFGYCTQPDVLASQLREHLALVPPIAEGLASTLSELIRQLEANSSAEAVFINDGMRS